MEDRQHHRQTPGARVGRSAWRRASYGPPLRRIDSPAGMFFTDEGKLSTMHKLVDRAVSSDCTRTSWWIGLIVLVVGTTLALCDPGTGAAMRQGRSGVAARAPRMPATMIACFDNGSKK